MQIVDRNTGDVIQYEPGLKVETDFLQDVLDRLEKESIGVFHSAGSVKSVVRRVMDEAVGQLKKKINPLHHAS